MAKKNRAVILVRVSTDKQVNDRQKDELIEVAASKGWEVVAVVEESISGKVSREDRNGLMQVWDLVEAGEVDKVMVHEVSRLARRNGVSHTFLDDLCERGVSLYWHGNRIETLDERGKRNPAASIMFAIMAEMARNEVEMLSERTKSGLRAARARGVVLGRPKGCTVPADTFLDKHRDVQRLLKAGKSVRDVSARTEKAPGTVMKVRKLLKSALGA